MSPARFMVARLTCASRQRLFLVSCPSVCCGVPASSRCIASSSRRRLAGETAAVMGLPG